MAVEEVSPVFDDIVVVVRGAVVDLDLNGVAPVVDLRHTYGSVSQPMDPSDMSLGLYSKALPLPSPG